MNPLRVDFSNFPTDERFAQIPGKLFLADNFDETDSQSFQQGRSVSRTVQVSMLLFFVCLSGELDRKSSTANQCCPCRPSRLKSSWPCTKS